MKSSIQKNEIESFNEALPLGFKTALKRWIESITLEGITPKFIRLNAHYMYDMVNDIVEILEVINKMESISFLQDDITSTFIVVSTTHTTKEFLIVWKCLDWESFLNTLLTAKVIPRVVVCLCN
jgi:hypothetical protein